jgi:hypothetical protein
MSDALASDCIWIFREVLPNTEMLIRRQQSRRGLGATDGFAFVPHTVAVFPDGNCWGSELKTPAKAEIPSPNQRIIRTTVRPAFIGFRHHRIALWVQLSQRFESAQPRTDELQFHVAACFLR